MQIIDYVYKVFGLDAFQRYCVSLAYRVELDSGLAGDMGCLTVGKVISMYCKKITVSEVYGYFLSDGILMRYFFYDDRKESLFLDRTVRLRRRMMDYLCVDGITGYEEYDNYLTRVLPDADEPGTLPETRVRIMEHLKEFLCKKKEEERYGIILYGEKGTGKRYFVKKLFREMERTLLMADGRIFTGDARQDRGILNDIAGECIFCRAGLLLCHMDDCRADISTISRFFEVMPVIFFSYEKETRPDLLRYGIHRYYINMEQSVCEDFLHLWTDGFRRAGISKGFIPENIPDKYQMNPGMIEDAMEYAQNLAHITNSPDGIITEGILNSACRHMLACDAGRKMTRIPPVYRWSDLILPGKQKELLRTACNQVRYKKQVYDTWGFAEKLAYGRGLSMIFSGLPGTGKTMAAQVIAGELGLELYKVELASVVSKYVGETEKNLEEIFEQAERSRLIILFDEADILFSKRTEVRDSNDKYSNMEAAYMLQKMESFEGIAVLSTNFLNNFDEAFKRRMKFIIDFPFPAAADRLEIWKKVFPQKLPLSEEVDFPYLAGRFELSGSNIKNAALHGSFLAAQEGCPVTMRHLIMAVRNEYDKIGKILQREELGEYDMYY